MQIGGGKMRVSKDKISFIMAEKGLYQKNLAEKAEMSCGNLSTIINGKNINARTALRLSKALDVSVESILED